MAGQNSWFPCNHLKPHHLSTKILGVLKNCGDLTINEIFSQIPGTEKRDYPRWITKADGSWIKGIRGLWVNSGVLTTLVQNDLVQKLPGYKYRISPYGESLYNSIMGVKE